MRYPGDGHCAKKPVTTMLTYPWKCTVLHCNHLGKRSGNNQSVGSSAPVVSRCFPGGYNVKLYISRGRLARWLLAFLCCGGMQPGRRCHINMTWESGIQTMNDWIQNSKQITAWKVQPTARIISSHILLSPSIVIFVPL